MPSKHSPSRPTRIVIAAAAIARVSLIVFLLLLLYFKRFSFTADEEVWGEQLALPVDLLNEMTNFFIPMHNQDFFEPFSPVKIQPIHRSFEDEIEEFPERVSEAEFIDVPNVSFDSSLLDSSNYTLALEFSVLSDDQDSTPDVPDPDDSQNSIIDVPDHEISYELEAEASNAANDNSILRDW